MSSEYNCVPETFSKKINKKDQKLGKAGDLNRKMCFHFPTKTVT